MTTSFADYSMLKYIDMKAVLIAIGLFIVLAILNSFLGGNPLG